MTYEASARVDLSSGDGVGLERNLCALTNVCQDGTLQTMKRGTTHDVILQMLTDTRQLDLHRHVRTRQNILGAYTAMQKHMRTTHSPSTQNNLLINLHSLLRRTPSTSKLHRRHVLIPIAVGRVAENETGDGSVGEDGEVRTRWERVDVCRSSVGTSPIGGVDGRCSDESARVVSSVGVDVGWDTEVGERVCPVA